MKNEKEKSAPTKRKRKKRQIPYHIIIPSGIAIILAATVLICFMQGMNMMSGAMSDFAKSFANSNTTMSNGMKLDENAEDYKGGYVAESQSGTIAIPGFETLKLKADTLKQTPGFFNPEDNSCYFVVELRLEDGTSIYKSGLLAPGKAIYSMELSQTLPKGTYTASVIYYCYSVETLAEQNGAQIKITLEVT